MIIRGQHPDYQIDNPGQHPDYQIDNPGQHPDYQSVYQTGIGTGRENERENLSLSGSFPDPSGSVTNLVTPDAQIDNPTGGFDNATPDPPDEVTAWVDSNAHRIGWDSTAAAKAAYHRDRGLFAADRKRYEDKWAEEAAARRRDVCCHCGGELWKYRSPREKCFDCAAVDRANHGDTLGGRLCRACHKAESANCPAAGPGGGDAAWGGG